MADDRICRRPRGKCRATLIVSGCIVIAAAATSVVFNNTDFSQRCSPIVPNATELESAFLYNTSKSLCDWKSGLFLALSSLCLAAYIGLLCQTVYSEPQRAYRPFSVTTWSAGVAMFGSMAIFCIGNTRLPGGVAKSISSLPTSVYDACVFGVAPSALSALIGYLGLAWLILNASGDVAAAIFGLPLTASTVIILAKGGELPDVVLVCAGISTIGLGFVLGCRCQEWQLRGRQDRQDDDLDESLLRGSKIITPPENV